MYHSELRNLLCAEYFLISSVSHVLSLPYHLVIKVSNCLLFYPSPYIKYLEMFPILEILDKCMCSPGVYLNFVTGTLTYWDKQ